MVLCTQDIHTIDSPITSPTFESNKLQLKTCIYITNSSAQVAYVPPIARWSTTMFAHSMIGFLASIDLAAILILHQEIHPYSAQVAHSQDFQKGGGGQGTLRVNCSFESL